MVFSQKGGKTTHFFHIYKGSGLNLVFETNHPFADRILTDN
jgi:hypothetical protein